MSLFGFRKYVHSRRQRRDKSHGGSFEAEQLPPKAEPPRRQNVFSPEDFVRFDGNIKALIVDENGLDVIYWRRLQEEENRVKDIGYRKEIIRRRARKDEDDENYGGFHKEIVSVPREDGDEDGGEKERDVDYYKESFRFKRADRIQETRGKSPPYYSKVDQEDQEHKHLHQETQESNVNRSGYRSGYTSSASSSSSSKINTFEAVERTEAKPPMTDIKRSPAPPPSPPPVPAAGKAPASPTPPAIPAANKTPAAPPPPPPPIPTNKTPAAPPPPPPVAVKKGPAPLPAPPAKATPPSKPPTAPKGSAAAESSSMVDQVKLKPLHWDKVNTDTDHSMVWDQINRGSFNFDSGLMEALFGYVATGKKSDEANSKTQNPISTSATVQTYIIDPRKSQNTAIVLKSIGMTKEEIIDLLTEGYEIDTETLEKLARIAPTQAEQTEILEFSGDRTKLADAESFLFHILKAVPSAFTRLNAMLFRMNYSPEIVHHKGSLQTLDLACKELRARGLFVKLLEAILKAGNRMNAGTARGNAQAFNLTALRKLSDVKSVDGKTTLLHFVVEEVVRSEGKRIALNSNRSGNEGSNSEKTEDPAATKEEKEKEYINLGLPVVKGLSSEFSNVKKAAGIDYDAFSATCLALTTRIRETKTILEQHGEGEDGFLKKMRAFLESAEEELKVVRDEETKVMELVKRTTEYFQAGALKDKNTFQLFVIIKDFLSMVDKVCGDMERNQQKKKPTATTTATGTTDSAPSPPVPRNAVRFPILPPNFLSENSRESSSESDSDS